ncbi:MAG TPA: DNA integrity scanning protein DisA nucleotide-binding domain protein [Archangium sp.]|nr:DNA integrity scanning protein DisA nucleotide-binding domain protein [Archangium sp.]
MLPASSNPLLRTLDQSWDSEARKGDSGLGGWSGIQERDIDDVLRDAGDRLLSNVQLAVWEEIYLSRNLFESINTIASLRYESSEPKAKVVFGKMEHGGPFELKFSNEVPLREAVWARKIIQLASDDFCILSDTESFLGLVCRNKPNPGEFWIRLTGQSQWKLGVEDKSLADVRFGIPSFPMLRLERPQFESTFKRVFASHDDNGIERIWKLVENVLGGNHGALIVVAEKADEEAKRLSSQATSIEPTHLSGHSASRATAIDGAMLLDPTGVCHAIGVILDGSAHPLGTPSRGARFNSAVRYVGATEGKGRLAVVISEDGQVNLLPRLRPPIKGSVLIELIKKFLFHPSDKSMPVELEERCIDMVRRYGIYVRIYANEILSDLDSDSREKLLRRAFMRLGISGRPDRAPLPYDPHESDFLDDVSEDQEEPHSGLPDNGDSSSEG